MEPADSVDEVVWGETQFEKELAHLINCHSMENVSDTPDFILAQYLTMCLTAYNVTIRARDELGAHDTLERVTR